MFISITDRLNFCKRFDRLLQKMLQIGRAIEYLRIEAQDEIF